MLIVVLPRSLEIFELCEGYFEQTQGCRRLSGYLHEVCSKRTKSYTRSS